MHNGNRKATYAILSLFAAIFIVLIGLMVFSTFSNMGSASNIMATGEEIGHTETSTIISQSHEEAVPLEDIESRLDDLIASATNSTLTQNDETDDMKLSGNIASARFNLTNGQVEQTFFGNWSAEIRGIDNSFFVADFKSGEEAHYSIGDFRITSFQRINDHVALGGTVDMSETHKMQSWQDAAVSIIIINGKALAISFEEPELSAVFSNQPVLGVVAVSP